MQERTHTIREDINLMPWHIEACDGLEQSCILVATMDGNEMLRVSLHVAQVSANPSSPALNGEPNL